MIKRSNRFLKQIIPIIAIILLALPFLLDSYTLHIIIMILLWSYLATAWNINGGYTGLISVGHSIFFGIGAYVAYFLFSWHGVSPWMGMCIAAGISAIASLMMYGALRYGIRGIYFALLTLACSIVLQDLFIALRERTGGSLGVWLPYLKGNNFVLFQFADKIYYYYIILAMYTCLLIAIKGLTNKVLVYCIAIREDEDVAASIGINVNKYRLLSLLISSVFVSIGGTFYFQYIRFIDPYTAFGLSTSLEMVFMAIFGGLYYLLGPTTGALLLVPLSEVFRILFGATYSGAHLIIYGILVILTIKIMPRGIFGKMEELILKKG